MVLLQAVLPDMTSAARAMMAWNAFELSAHMGVSTAQQHKGGVQAHSSDPTCVAHKCPCKTTHALSARSKVHRSNPIFLQTLQSACMQLKPAQVKLSQTHQCTAWVLTRPQQQQSSPAASACGKQPACRLHQTCNSGA